MILLALVVVEVAAVAKKDLVWSDPSCSWRSSPSSALSSRSISYRTALGTGESPLSASNRAQGAVEAPTKAVLNREDSVGRSGHLCVLLPT